MHNGPNAKDEYDLPFLETPCLILIFGAKMNKIVTPAQNIHGLHLSLVLNVMFSMFSPSSLLFDPAGSRMDEDEMQWPRCKVDFLQ